MAAEGKYESQMTLAELSQAIEEGRLPYSICDGHYEVRAADVRRLHRPGRGSLRFALPDPAEIPAELLDCPDMGQLDFSA
ncbi:MAG TPA: hypothetical protein VF116_23700 [Ktedonobacterales bacterium]